MGVFDRIGFFKKKSPKPVEKPLPEISPELERLRPDMTIKDTLNDVPPRATPQTDMIPTPMPTPTPPTSHTESSPNLENIKAKIDLLVTQMDNIKTQNENINERLKNIEKTLNQMKGIRYY